MTVDAHAHYGDWYFPIKNPDAAAISRTMKALGIDRIVLSSSLAIVYDFREGNAELAAAMRDHPEFSGYVAVNLNYPEESIAEIDSRLSKGGERGFVGIKVHPMLDDRSFDGAEGMLVTEAASRHGVPILIHTFGSPVESPRNILKAAHAFPEAKFIIGHMGGYDWEAGIEVAKACPNSWLEICSTCTDMRRLRAAIKAVGIDRILFGTDATLFASEYTLGALDDMEISEAERKKIMGENAARLFGFQS